eukprot:2911531-Pleurochrysis_carterae.AAC.3
MQQKLVLVLLEELYGVVALSDTPQAPCRSRRREDAARRSVRTDQLHACTLDNEETPASHTDANRRVKLAERGARATNTAQKAPVEGEPADAVIPCVGHY